MSYNYLIYKSPYHDRLSYLSSKDECVNNNKPGYVIIGLALFSMFFGSGNLIYPLMLGRDSGSAYIFGALGFVITAVLLPCLGIISIALAEGNYELIFGRLLKGKIALGMIFLVLLSFIPFGAGPRCVVLAHASLKTFISMPPLWLFSLLFLGLVGYLVSDKSHLLNVLGKLLTPTLLISIGIMVASAFIHGEIDPPLLSNMELFERGLYEGYNTQDLLSSLFFSSSLIALVSASFKEKRIMVMTVLKGSLVSIVMLGVLYVILIAAASLHSDILVGHSGIDLVSILAKHTLGARFGLIAGIAVALACLTTAVALIMAFSQFLSAHILAERHKRFALPLSLLCVFLTSLLRFEGIMVIISSLMKLIYPILLMIVLVFLVDFYLRFRALKK